MLDFNAHCSDDLPQRGEERYQPPAPTPYKRTAARMGGTNKGMGKAASDDDAALRQELSACLVAVAAHQDRKAYARLFHHYAPRLKSFMRHLGTDDALAEELAQEAMLTVWRRAALFDPVKAGPGTWIFTIARNLRIDHLRRQPRPEVHSDDAALVPDPAPAADDVVAVAQDEGRVRAAMALLPPEQATVVRLSFFEDTPHAEIALRLHLPLGTVKSRLRLAMRRIRLALEDRLDGPSPAGKLPNTLPGKLKDAPR